MIMIKKGDLEGIINITEKLRKINIEQIYDDYGEVVMTDKEQEGLLKLFECEDVSILCKINPI